MGWGGAGSVREIIPLIDVALCRRGIVGSVRGVPREIRDLSHRTNANDPFQS